jgi:hypothetical protein
VYITDPTKVALYRLQEELLKSDVIVNGTWTTVYKTPDGKCLKQVSAPGVSHTDFNHVSLPTPFRYCTRGSGNLITMLAHRISTRFMMLSVHRIKDMNSEFFPKIYDIDDKKRRYIQDYVPNELNPITCPENYKQQIQAISDELEEHGYYVDDIHSKNWMVDNKGILKIIDGELFTDNELYVQQFILNLIDGSQDGNAVPHTDGDRILHWNDGRPNIYGVCK